MKRILKILFPVIFGMIILISGTVGFAKPTEINYYSWDSTYQPIIDAFNASQKDVLVKMTIVPASDYETKMVTMLAGGANVDCFAQKRQTDMFPDYKNGFIEPLNKYIKTTKYNLKSIQAYTSQVTVKGKVLAIPFRGAGYYTYYNKKIFAKAGIPTPDEYVKKGEWTWDKFAEVAKKLSSGDGKLYGANIYIWPTMTFFPASQKKMTFMDAKGKVRIDPKAISYCIKLRRDLERAKAMMSISEQRSTKTHYSKGFYDGTAAMLIIGEWFPGYMITGRDQKLLKGYGWNDWAITRLPCNSSKFVTIGACTFNHIYSRSKKKAAAFKFIAWMGSSEGAANVARVGLLPPVVDKGVKAQLAKVVPDKESLNYFVESAPRIPPGSYTEYGSQIEAVLGLELDKYLTSNMTENVFVKELKTQLTQIANSNK
jgi:multiple sugar transport system substrate-binding protein